MKLGHVGFDGEGPLTELEFVQKALGPMLDAKENQQIEAKMQKMKNHISNLPNIHMLT